MKRFLIIVVALGLLVAAWFGGRQTGIQYAISHAFFETGGEETNHPDTDWILYIELDGEIYASELFIY